TGIAADALRPLDPVWRISEQHVGFEPFAVFGEAVAVVEGYVVVLVVEGRAFLPALMPRKYPGRIALPRLSASRSARRRLWRMIAGRSSMTEASKDKD